MQVGNHKAVTKERGKVPIVLFRQFWGRIFIFTGPKKYGQGGVIKGAIHKGHTNTNNEDIDLSIDGSFDRRVRIKLTVRLTGETRAIWNRGDKTVL